MPLLNNVTSGSNHISGSLLNRNLMTLETIAISTYSRVQELGLSLFCFVKNGLPVRNHLQIGKMCSPKYGSGSVGL